MVSADMTPPAAFVISPAHAVDLSALAEFLEPFIVQEKLLPRTHEELGELARNGFVALHGDQIVGFAALEIYSPKLGEVRSLAVSPLHQRQGIGQALVRACIERARERRVFEIMAITSSDEFFKTCGFDFTLPGEKKALFMQTRDAY